MAPWHGIPRVAMLLICVIGSGPGPALAQDVWRDPEQVRLEVEDVRRLAEILRSIETGGLSDTAAVIEREYIAKGSRGLRVYVENYKVDAASITSAIRTHPSAYRDLNLLADAILAQEDTLRTALGRLLEVFPEAVFPPIWFVAANHGPGGLTRQEGVLIAAERFATSPRDIVPLVLHELAHFQQGMVQGIDVYRRIYGPDQTLLALALREGSAEFIAHLTTGRHINPTAERYGLANESELWCRFRGEMHKRDPGDWMFTQPSESEVPADLGYWIGYRIVDSYYDQAADKEQAILDILGLIDFDNFLQRSGYQENVRCS